MATHEKWAGTKAESTKVVDYFLTNIRDDLFPELSRKEVYQLFEEAFCRNIVQAELREMMIYIKEEENKA